MNLVRKDCGLSIRRQCRLLGVPRSRLCRLRDRRPKGSDLELARVLDRLHTEDPSAGSRRLAALASGALGRPVNRKRAQRVMRRMQIRSVRVRRSTSESGVRLLKFPYLLDGMTVERPNQVWCSDVTYVPMERGFMYLSVVMDWRSRRALGAAVSNTPDATLTLEALEQALAATGCVPEIMNTDQGCQYTSAAWLQRLDALGVRISMDGKGRWLDNVVVERFWRSIKYESLYLWEIPDGRELKRRVLEYVWYYNNRRPHQGLGNRTPEEVYSKVHAACGGAAP